MIDIFEEFTKASDEKKWKLYSSLVDTIENDHLSDEVRVKAIDIISLYEPEFVTCSLNWVFSNSDVVAEAVMNAINRNYSDTLIYHNVNTQHSLNTILFRGTDFEKIRVCQLFGILRNEKFFEYLYSAVMISQSEKVREQALKALLSSDRPDDDKIRVINHLRNLNWGGSTYSHLDFLLNQFDSANTNAETSIGVTM